MKEFDKCWSENSDAHRYIDSNHHEIAEYYWRAALEWLLDLYWHKSNNPELFRELLEDELELDK